MRFKLTSRQSFRLSLLVLGISLITVPYLHEYVQLSVCSVEGVSGNLYYYNWYYIMAACSAERTWDDLFEISGGLVLGFAFLGFFALSLAKKWDIGILTSLPLASFQFTEAYIANSAGYMYTHFTHFVPLTWIVVSGLVFVAMVYALPKLSKLKIPNLGKFSTVYLVIVGTVTVSLLLHNLLLPDVVTNYQILAIDTAIMTIFFVIFHKKDPVYASAKNSVGIEKSTVPSNFPMYG